MTDLEPRIASRATSTGGRSATEGVIPGRYALSVGKPERSTPEGWRWTALTDVARLETGHTPSRRHPEWWDGEIPWIGIRDATSNHGRTIHETLQNTNDLGIAHSSARVLPANTVCLSRTASVGYVVVMGRPMATSQDFVNWVCSDDLDFRFLKYVLLAERETFPSFASGTTHQTIYFPEVKAFHICLPSIEVQRRIADVLSAYDELIENNTRRIKILEGIAQAIYKEWFVNFRYPGHESVPLVDSPLGPIPDGWKVSKIAELACKKKHAVTGGPFGSKLGRADYRDDGVPVIRGGNLTVGGGYRDEGYVYVSDSKASELASSVAVPGDIVITQRGTLGQVGLIPLTARHERYVISQSQMKITVDPASTSVHYLYSALRSHEVTARIESMAFSSGVPHINLSLLRGFEVVVPSPSLQAEFNQFAGEASSLIESLTSANDALTSARDLLLPRLVSGEVKVDPQ